MLGEGLHIYMINVIITDGEPRGRGTSRATDAASMESSRIIISCASLSVMVMAWELHH